VHLQFAAAQGRKDVDEGHKGVIIPVIVLGLLPDLTIGEAKDRLTIPPFKISINNILDRR
jgi:hypothetical protein